jgi:ribosome recycling factor
VISESMKSSEERMLQALEHFKEELGKLRTGQATLSLLDGIKVDYYGNKTPLGQAATLGAPDTHTLTIQPWDASLLKEIEKAIVNSDLGMTPSNDGKMIRLNIPPLTHERRLQLVKLVKKNEEDCKVAIRNVRREFNDKVKAAEKKHEISEDDSRKAQDEIQKSTDKHIASAGKLALAKEKDLLET